MSQGGIDKLVVGILVTTTLLSGSILASLHAKVDNESNNAPSTNVVDDVTIITGTQTSGDTSNWAMKLVKVENPVSGDPITYNPDILTIISNYDDTYYNVPSTFTKVVEYKDSTLNTSSATDQTLGAHIETTSSTGNSHYHLGNYYNWTAALAMSDSSSYGVYDEGTGEYTNTETNQSICPAGWTLPKSGDQTGTGSFSYLVNQASLTAGTTGNIHTTPNWFVYGGGWGGGLGDVGDNGSYWSSVAYNDSDAYSLAFDTADGHLYPQKGLGRNIGYSVRCIARP